MKDEPKSAARARAKKGAHASKKKRASASAAPTKKRASPSAAPTKKRASAGAAPEKKRASTGPGLRILGMEEVEEGTELVVARGWGLRDAATAPCAHCPSKCCSLSIALTVVEAVRMGFTLRLPFSEFLDHAPVHTTGAERFSHTIELDVGPRHLTLRRIDGWCGHLVRPGTPHSRCGVYELRPAVCRLFPFLFELDGEAVSVGHGSPHCPVRWAVTPGTATRLEVDARRWRDDVARSGALVAHWNDVERDDRSFEAFLAWLKDDAGPREGYGRHALDVFPERPRFAFLKQATRSVL